MKDASVWSHDTVDDQALKKRHDGIMNFQCCDSWTQIWLAYNQSRTPAMNSWSWDDQQFLSLNCGVTLPKETPFAWDAHHCTRRCAAFCFGSRIFEGGETTAVKSDNAVGVTTLRGKHTLHVECHAAVAIEWR